MFVSVGSEAPFGVTDWHSQLDWDLIVRTRDIYYCQRQGHRIKDKPSNLMKWNLRSIYEVLLGLVKALTTF